MLLTEVDTCPSSLCSSSPSQDSFLYLLRDLAFQPFTLYIMYCYQTLCILYIVLHMWSLYDVRPLFCWCCTFNFPSFGTIKDSVLFYFPLFPSSLCLGVCLLILPSFHSWVCCQVFSSCGHFSVCMCLSSSWWWASLCVCMWVNGRVFISCVLFNRTQLSLSHNAAQRKPCVYRSV